MRKILHGRSQTRSQIGGYVLVFAERLSANSTSCCPFGRFSTRTVEVL